MSTQLRQAISAIKSGDKATGQRLLREILRTDPSNEQAWLWMTEVTDADDDRVKCLQNVLKINPNNEMAKQGLAVLQKKQPTESRSTAAREEIPLPGGEPINLMTAEPTDRLSNVIVLERIAAARSQGLTPDLDSADLANINLNSADLTRVNLRGANLNEADLVQANLRHSNLNGANLSQANLNRASLCEAELRDANLDGCCLVGADLTGSNLAGASLIEADLRWANLSNCNLSRASLSGITYNPQTIWPVGFTVPVTQQPLGSQSTGAQPTMTRLSEENEAVFDQNVETIGGSPIAKGRIKATSSRLRWLAQEGYLDDRGLEYALAIAGIIPDRKLWLKYVNYLLLILGTAFTLSGVFFFFAYNWADMHHFLKFGVIEIAIIGAVIAAWQQGIGRLSGKIALLVAAMLVGALLAVFGQVYQTGANAYTLFLNWMLLIIGWVVIGNFPVLWLAWLILLNLTWGFYWYQVLDSERWTPTLIFETFVLLNATALAGWEVAGRWLPDWRTIRWIPRLVVTGAVISLTIPVLVFIFEPFHGDDRFIGVAPVFYVGGIVLAVLVYYYLRDLFILALCALSVIVVTTSTVARFLDLECVNSIILSALIIFQAWIAVMLLRWVHTTWVREP